MTTRYWGPFRAMLGGASPAGELRAFEGFAARLYDQMSVVDWDEDDYLRIVAARGGGALELGCGTGRILLRLAEAGYRVVGVDRAPEMLAVLHERLDQATEAVRSRVSVVCGDAAELELPERFPVILLPYLTIGLLDDDESRVRVLQRANAHLAPGGVFVFDFLTILAPDADSLAGAVLERTFLLRGRQVPGTFGARYLPEERSLVVNAHLADGDASQVLSLPVRTFDPEEIDRLLDQAGLVVLDAQVQDFPDGAARRTLLTCASRFAGPQHLWHPYGGPEDPGAPTFVAGHGCELIDDTGRRYLDASGGLWSVQCGLGNEEIVEAVAHQLRVLSYATLFLGRRHDVAVRLARRLTALAPPPLTWAFLTGSGSESVELSIKIVRSYFALAGNEQKRGVLFLDASYHGTFFGSIGVSGSVPEKEAFSPQLPGLGALPAPIADRRPAGMTAEAYVEWCAEVFERMLEHASSHIAAFILEPVLGAAGAVVLPKAYVDRISRACRRHEVLLVVDEVATGFGRTGTWFASEQVGLRPDLLLLAKGINSGYLPLGAVLFSAQIGERLRQSPAGLVHGSSHNGNPACCAAALATIDILEREGLVARAAELGAHVRRLLAARTGTPGLGEVRGLGLLLFVGLIDAQARPWDPAAVLDVVAEMARRGVLVYPAPGGILLAPPLVITEAELELVVDCLFQALGALGAAHGAAWR